MPTFDPNKYKQLFDQQFGAGAFDKGMQQAQQIGYLKEQTSLAKSDFTSKLNKLKSAQNQNKSYQDAVSYWSDPTNKQALQQQGAYGAVNAIKNDPSKQAEIKAQGYNLNDYYNAMYNAASDGKFKSEREYNQFASQLNKDNAPNRKANKDSIQAVIDADKATAAQAKQLSQPPTTSSNNPSLLGGLLDKLKNSEVGRAATAAEQFFNPFDNVSAKDAVNNYLNHKQSNTFQEVARGANRAADSASLGLMSNLDKKVNNRTPYYNSARPIGQGGGTDMITSALGYLVPGVGIEKGIGVLGIGTKEASGLAKLGQIAGKGALAGGTLTGAQTGINYALNPKDQNLKDNLENIGLGIGLGAVGDPLLHGAGNLAFKGMSKFAKADIPAYTGKPSEGTLSKLLPNSNSIGNSSKSTSLFNDLLASNPKDSNVTMNPTDKQHFQLQQVNSQLNALKPKINEYQKEFNDAVQHQYDYLKSSMGKGVDYGTTGTGTGNFREVNGSFSVSRNPKWYQDFYAATGRKPTNAELKQMAVDHVKNGFQDELGSLPPWQPKKVQEIDHEISNIQSMLKEQPEQAPHIQPILDALQQEKNTALKESSQVMKDYQSLQEQQNKLMQGLPKLKEKAMNISAAPNKKVPGMLPPSELDNHGYGLIDTQAEMKAQSKPNPLDMPYKQGDVLPNTLNHIGTKTEKTLPSLPNVANKAYIKGVDNLHRLSQFDNQVSKVLGRDLKPTESTHMLGLNSRGSDMISKQILTQDMVNKNGEAVGQSLKDITMKVPKGKLSDFEDYLVNKHAITRMKRGEKVFPDEMNMTTGKAAEKVRQYDAKYPQFKDLANQYYDYNKQLGQHWLVDTGILSKSDWEGYLKENPHYVPNNRIFSDLEKPTFTNSAKKGFANQSNPVKKAIGSQRKIVSPIESTIEHTAQYVKTAKRNEVMQTLINNIKQNPEAFKGWAEIVPTDKTPQSVMDTLNKEGINGVLENVNKGFDQKPDLTKGNIIRGLVDGKPVHVRVNDPQLLDALTNLQPKAQNMVIHSLGQVTRVMKNLTTGINPVFSLTRNIFRDIPTAYTNSKSTNNPITFSKDLVQSVVSVMKNDELYRSFKAIGGGHSSPISSDANLLAQSKQSILLQKGLQPLLHKGLGALENLNNAVEAAPRLAEFKRLSKPGTYDSKTKALYEANDVTVNFNKYGNLTKDVDQIVPYFNAAIQGLDKQYRAMISPNTPAKEKIMAGIKAFVGITVPTIIMYAVNHNDPNYQQVSNYVKDTNILIPKGDGTFYKIPKPRELGILFGSDVERVLRSWVDRDPKAFQDFASDVQNTFMPPLRTTLAPFSDIRANQNYNGAPIVPADLQGLSPRYQYDAQTSEPAKFIGNMTNISPKQLDYLGKSYLGVVGELGLPLMTKNSSIGQTLNQKVSVDPVFSNDIMKNFYNQKTLLDQANADYTKQGIVGSNLNGPLRKAMNSQVTQISKLRKQSKAIQNDSSLTPQQRLEKIRQLQQIMNQIASQNVR